MGQKDSVVYSQLARSTILDERMSFYTKHLNSFPVLALPRTIPFQGLQILATLHFRAFYPLFCRLFAPLISHRLPRRYWHASSTLVFWWAVPTPLHILKKLSRKNWSGEATLRLMFTRLVRWVVPRCETEWAPVIVNLEPSTAGLFMPYAWADILNIKYQKLHAQAVRK